MEIYIGGTRHIVRNFQYKSWGGQGIIYKAEIEGENYALKVHQDDELNRRTDQIHERVRGRELPDALTFRSFPVGYGTASSREIIDEDGEDWLVIVFKWVEGEGFLQYIRRSYGSISVNQRERQAKQLLYALHFFEKCGIVHGDLSLKNILVDNSGNLHIIDVESSGLLQRNNEWFFKPRTFGTVFPGIPRAPELQRGEISPYVDRWSLASIIAFILTKKLPFAFLRDIGESSLKELYEIAEKRRGSDEFEFAWPPLGAEEHPRVYTNCDITALRREFSRYRELPYLLYRTFIMGFERFERRPDAREWLTRLGI